MPKTTGSYLNRTVLDCTNWRKSIGLKTTRNWNSSNWEKSTVWAISYRHTCPSTILLSKLFKLFLVKQEKKKNIFIYITEICKKTEINAKFGELLHLKAKF